VLDRFIQQAIAQVLTPIFDPTFSESSFGFRPGRKAHDAVKQLQGYAQAGYTWVVDLDLEKFFDRVNHDVLMARVARKVTDKRVMRLIRRYLQSGIMQNGVCVKSEEGTPQGGPLSPLLANILLDDLDKELERRGHRFARYADDCNIMVRSERGGRRVMRSITHYLEQYLRLKVNREKSAVDRPWKRKFLGFGFYRRKGQVRIRIAPKALERFKDRVRGLTSRRKPLSMARRIDGAQPVPAGMDGLLCTGGCTYDAGSYGPVDTPKAADLPVEAVEANKGKTKEPAPTRTGGGSHQPRGRIKERVLANRQYPSVESGDGFCLLAEPRPSQLGAPIPRTAFGFLNRRMRTRMSGGVRGRRGDPASYPICTLLS